VPQVTIIRIIALIIIGLILFWALLSISRIKETSYLKKRKKTADSNSENIRARIIVFYFIALTTGVLLLFLIIRFIIRGELCEYKIG
jgi:ABC-type Fe3+ transport system permease subunit